MATITKEFSARMGINFWVVTWGKGITETATCLTEAGAIALANGDRREGSVMPLVSFR